VVKLEFLQWSEDFVVKLNGFSDVSLNHPFFIIQSQVCLVEHEASKSDSEEYML
jgi:hypothetical protein